MGLTTLQKDKLREAEGLVGLHPGPAREIVTPEGRLIEVIHRLARTVKLLADQAGIDMRL